MPIDLWVIQKNLGSTKDIEAIINACKEIDCEYRLVDAIPFSRHLPDIENDRKVVFYGSSNFTTNIYRSGKWQPGVFFDEESFSYSSALKHYSGKMLNYDAQFGSMIALAKLSYEENQVLFFRPDKDLKEFAGTVQTFGEFKSWVTTLAAGDFEINVSSQALLASIKELAHEWRVFIVNGKAVTGSHYRSYGKLTKIAGIPEEIVDFCETAAKHWSPAPVFVMDIAEANGNLFIIEINGFNSSGFYLSDIEKIVEAVTYYE
jgi:ATP-grasp domain, R2K clade family 3